MNMLFVIVLAAHLVLVVVSQVAMKLATNSLPKAKAMGWMFTAALLISALYGLVSGEVMWLGRISVLIALVGVISSLGTFCQWNAYRYSLSKSSLFQPLDQVFATTLAAVFLGEAFLYSSPLLVASVALMFLAAVLLSCQGWSDDRVNAAWFGWVAGMVVIFGGAIFFQKCLAGSVSVPAFLVCWYLGGVVGSLVLVWLEKDQRAVPVNEMWKVVLAAGGILGSLATLYAALGLAPASVVLPIKSFGATALVVLAGLIVFKERQSLPWSKVLGLAAGLIGLLLLVVSRS